MSRGTSSVWRKQTTQVDSVNGHMHCQAARVVVMVFTAFLTTAKASEKAVDLLGHRVQVDVVETRSGGQTRDGWHLGRKVAGAVNTQECTRPLMCL